MIFEEGIFSRFLMANCAKINNKFGTSLEKKMNLCSIGDGG
jgi:hypothetical protein